MSSFDPLADQPSWTHPGIAIDVGAGSPVVVRCLPEHRWQALEAELQPFILSFAPIFDAGYLPDLDCANLRICDHIRILLPAIFEATGLDAETFEALPEGHHQLVTAAWWAVNGAYRVSHIFSQLRAARAALRVCRWPTDCAPTNSTTK